MFLWKLLTNPKRRLSTYEALLTKEGLSSIREEHVLFTNFSDKKVTFTTYWSGHGSGLCFYDTMLSGILEELGKSKDVGYPRLMYNLETFQIVKYQLSKIEQFYKQKHYVLTAYFVILYFLLTNNPVLEKTVLLEKALNKVLDSSRVASYNNEDNLYNEAIKHAMPILMELENDFIYRKPFHWKDWISSIPYQLTVEKKYHE